LLNGCARALKKWIKKKTYGKKKTSICHYSVSGADAHRHGASEFWRVPRSGGDSERRQLLDPRGFAVSMVNFLDEYENMPFLAPLGDSENDLENGTGRSLDWMSFGTVRERALAASRGLDSLLEAIGKRGCRQSKSESICTI
jgi:hypothetical protein